MFFNKIKNDLRTKWTVQLYKEFDNICYQHRVNLKKPVIIIEELKCAWGNWNEKYKTITIALDLIDKYSWDIVINILKHEMAHMIVSEVFFSRDLHGKDFLRACDILAVPYAFCKATLNIEEKIPHIKDKNLSPEEDGIIRKLNKLLSLAQSENENEALLAMEKVQELYTKYNIKAFDNLNKSDFYTLVISFRKKKIPNTYVSIASILQEFYYVDIVFSEIYSPLNDEIYKSAEILGTKHNVLMAEYIFYFLIERMESLWQVYKKNNGARACFKISYQKGIMLGFRTKLDLIFKNKIKKDKCIGVLYALIELHDCKLKDFTKRQFPRLTKRGSGFNQVYTEHFNNGKIEGKNIVLNKPMNSYKNRVIFLE